MEDTEIQIVKSVHCLVVVYCDLYGLLLPLQWLRQRMFLCLQLGNALAMTTTSEKCLLNFVFATLVAVKLKICKKKSSQISKGSKAKADKCKS